jgi:pilus assembly protein CpaE
MATKKLQVVLIEADPDTRYLLRETLLSLADVEIIAETDSLVYGYELVRQNKPHLVLIDLRDHIAPSLQVIERMATYQHDSMVFASGEELSLDALSACMQAGVREFLQRPIDPEQVALLVERHRAHLMVDKQSGDRSGRLMTVFSNKGGLGKTTIAVNLAIALSELTQTPVALVDLNLQLGDITTFLDIQPKQTIVDIARNLSRVDQTYLENSLAYFETDKAKLYVMADPSQVEEAEEVTASQINSILSVLKSSFEYVVVDTTTSFDAKTLTALDLADNILLTSIINLPCIRSTQRVLTLFDRLGYDEQKIKLVINRFVPGEDISIEDVETTLDREVFCKLPNNYQVVMASINRGLPISSVDRDSAIWQQFVDLSYKLTGMVQGNKNKDLVLPELTLPVIQKKSVLSSPLNALGQLFQKR